MSRLADNKRLYSIQNTFCETWPLEGVNKLFGEIIYSRTSLRGPWDHENYLLISGFSLFKGIAISDLFITRFHCILFSQQKRVGKVRMANTGAVKLDFHHSLSKKGKKFLVFSSNTNF